MIGAIACTGMHEMASNGPASHEEYKGGTVGLTGETLRNWKRFMQRRQASQPALPESEAASVLAQALEGPRDIALKTLLRFPPYDVPKWFHSFALGPPPRVVLADSLVFLRALKKTNEGKRALHGFLPFVGCSLVFWRARKQVIVGHVTQLPPILGLSVHGIGF
jgi:hypothetical protein